MKKTKFFSPKDKNWVVIDARDKILGRLATRIARILQGKDKPIYTPNAICGDAVVVVNARQIKLTANKSETKSYKRYSGYPSGLSEMSFKELMQKNPSRILYKAVKGMLPKNNLGIKMGKSLKIYADGQHEQQAQQPKAVSI